MKIVVLFLSILILTYSLQQSAAANVVFGNPLVPSSGGSAGCWIQLIQQPVTQNEVCIYLLTLHLNQGTQADPPNAFEIRVYEVNQTANVGTLKRQRDVVVDVTNQDEQVARLSSCLMAYKGEYVGIANAQGAMRDTVVSGGSPSWKYWNKFEATSKVIGSTITLDSEFGPGSLGWRIDAVNGTTMPPKETTTTTNAPGVPSIGTTTTTGGFLITTTFITGVATTVSVFQGENQSHLISSMGTVLCPRQCYCIFAFILSFFLTYLQY